MDQTQFAHGLSSFLECANAVDPGILVETPECWCDRYEASPKLETVCHSIPLLPRYSRSGTRCVEVRLARW